MKRILTLALAILLSACGEKSEDPGSESINGSGKVVTQMRRSGPFKSIKVNLPCDLKLLLGRNSLIQIRTDENVLPHITSELKDGELCIASNRLISDVTELTVIVSLPELQSLTLNSTGNANLQGFHGGEFELVSNGPFEIELAGVLNEFKAALNGGGRLEGFSLRAEDVGITINGSAQADVLAERRLDVSINGTGFVRYRGNAIVNKKIAGEGSILKL